MKRLVGPTLSQRSSGFSKIGASAKPTAGRTMIGAGQPADRLSGDGQRLAGGSWTRPRSSRAGAGFGRPRRPRTVRLVGGVGHVQAGGPPSRSLEAYRLGCALQAVADPGPRGARDGALPQALAGRRRRPARKAAFACSWAGRRPGRDRGRRGQPELADPPRAVRPSAAWSCADSEIRSESSRIASEVAERREALEAARVQVVARRAGRGRDRRARSPGVARSGGGSPRGSPRSAARTPRGRRRPRARRRRAGRAPAAARGPGR